MKMLIEFLRFFFVSFESVVFLLLLMCLFCVSQSGFSFANDLMANNEIVKYLSLLPVGVFVWMFVYLRKLLFPEKDINKIMQSWPDYYKLKSCIYAAMLWGVVFSVAAIVGWILSITGIFEASFILITCSILGSLIDACSVYFAEISINERFCRGSDSAAVIKKTK